MTWFVELRRRLFALLGLLRGRGRAVLERLSLPVPVGSSVSAPPVTDVQSEPAADAAVAVPTSAALAAPVVGPPIARSAAMDPSLGQLKARQFFARMIAATPAGLTIDFSDWRSASVERFFLAMTSPGLTRRREVPTNGSEQVSLTNAFQGFEWD